MKLNSKTEVYAYGNYAQRKIEGGFYYRSPNTRDGIFNDGFYLGDKDNPSRSHLSKVDYRKREYPGYDALEDKDPRRRGSTNCLMINFPTMTLRLIEGSRSPIWTLQKGRALLFRQTPRLTTAKKLQSLRIPTLTATCSMKNFPADSPRRSEGRYATGVERSVSAGDISDWHYDLSAVFGQHSTDFFMTNTINPQLASLKNRIPTNYNPGGYTERDRVLNLDFSRSLPTAMFRSPLNIRPRLGVSSGGIRNLGRRCEFHLY